MDIGAQLRTARETRGLSLETLAHTLRVKAHILSAIEHNDLSTVPPRPFGRGVVRAYAHEVGLDPDGTAREYFARFAPVETAASPDEAPPVRVPRPLSIGAALTLVGFAFVVWVGWRGSTEPTVPAGAAAPVGTSGSTVSPPADSRISPHADSTDSPLAGSTATSPAGASGPESPTEGMTVTLHATRECWVAVTADGRRVLYRLLQPGSRETITASHAIVIRTGDAGALLWSRGDASPQEAGRPGEVKTFTIPAVPAAR